MRAVAITLVALALASSIAGATISPPPASGLRGVVMRGPTKPVCFETEPCEAPAAGIVLQFRRAGALVARIKTGTAGGYKVRLRPGTYAARTGQTLRLGSQLTPAQARVPQGRIARLDFHIDTGIQ
jgi:hypothetical protein